jgi:hypothetical protein
MDRSDIKAEAATALRRSGCKTPPIDPQRVADSLGICTIFCQFTDGHPANSDMIAAFYDEDHQAIYVNTEISAKDKTHAVAAELGKRLLYPEWTLSPLYQASKRSGLLRTMQEVDADLFARYLCAPSALIDKYLPTASLSELADIFCYPAEKLATQIGTIGKHVA